MLLIGGGNIGNGTGQSRKETNLYAVQLFDEKLYNQEFSLFENDKPEPALSIENAYFKTEKQASQAF